MGFEWRRRGIGHALETAISYRMIGLVKRLNAVFVRWRAGTLRPPRPRAVRERAAPAERAQPAPRAPSVLPRRYGWLKRLLPGIAHTMNAFAPLLTDPEMQEILAAAPQVGRILRPFCHVLGLELPPELALPRRVRVRKKKDPLPPHPAAARFPDTPAARSAARALARMQAGLPVDVTRLSSVAYGYFVHPPRDDLCPPPEIGYARSRLRLPKDYDPSNWD
jgi:hypothetical protein